MANFPYTLGLFTAPCSTVAGFMAIRLVVAVTDREWFDHLRTKLALSEANFWSPSGAAFRALEPGELFLFKLIIRPDSAVPSNTSTHFSEAVRDVGFPECFPCQRASERLSVSKHATTADRVIRRVRSDFAIGCRILTRAIGLTSRRVGQEISLHSRPTPLKTPKALAFGRPSRSIYSHMVRNLVSRNRVMGSPR